MVVDGPGVPPSLVRYPEGKYRRFKQEKREEQREEKEEKREKHKGKH